MSAAPIVQYISNVIGPTGVTKTIPSYLYLQYSDDSDLQAFIRSYNTMTQQYVDWFDSTELPIYTSPSITNGLLDWVAKGLYGKDRPVLPSGVSISMGGFNTYPYNKLNLAYNQFKLMGPSNYYVTNDDVFKRILTWHFFKGDGKYFTIQWLKRRVMRFLTGTNGLNINGAGKVGIDQTYQVSITFGTNYQVNINILNGNRKITGGSIYNDFAFNTMGYNVLTSQLTVYAPLTMAPVLAAAINSGVLELPFQYTYNVNIVG